MVDFLSCLEGVQPVNVLCIGDFMLDAYIFGSADRVSPEAPVLVVRVEDERSLPGGAGNVCLNLKSFGARAFALGRVGLDEAGESLQTLLQEKDVDVSGLVVDPNYKTPLKKRVLAGGQQVVRIDHEGEPSLSKEGERALIERLDQSLDQIDQIAISDYGKGVLTPSLTREVMRCAGERGIPVLVDPKGDDFTKYRGATVIKPNVKESYIATRRTRKTPLDEVAEELLAITNVQALLITRSEKGMTLYPREGTPSDFPARVREVNDVTGAGDAVLATLAVALGNNFSLPEAIHLSNLVAGFVIERTGCVQITFEEVRRALAETSGEV